MLVAQPLYYTVFLIMEKFYTSFSLSGGLASVIYTDTLQTVVLIAGAIVVTSMCKSIFISYGAHWFSCWSARLDFVWLLVRHSPPTESPWCVLEQDTFYLCLILVQPKKTDIVPT